MRFDPVSPPELGRWWDVVGKGITEIRDLCGEEWRAEDVYANLKAQRAHLFLMHEGNDLVGFAVLEIIQDVITAKPYLNVWLMHLVNRTDAVRQDLVGWLDTCARNSGCKVIRFVSPRKGWMRFLEGEFLPKSVIYERAVT